jgi:hypothetical protein
MFDRNNSGGLENVSPVTTTSSSDLANNPRVLSISLDDTSPMAIKDVLQYATNQLPPATRSALVQETTKQLPKAEQKAVATGAMQELPLSDRKDVANIVALGTPSSLVRDDLWKIVIYAFSIILVGSFVTLALNVFWAPVSGGTSGQVILTMFTSAVGFLAGLFVPSPARQPNGG